LGTLIAIALFIIAVVIICKIVFHALVFIFAFGKAFWKPLVFYAACALSAILSYKIGLHDKFHATTFDKVACVIFVIFAPLFLKKK